MTGLTARALILSSFILLALSGAAEAGTWTTFSINTGVASIAQYADARYDESINAISEYQLYVPTVPLIGNEWTQYSVGNPTVHIRAYIDGGSSAIFYGGIGIANVTITAGDSLIGQFGGRYYHELDIPWSFGQPLTLRLQNSASTIPQYTDGYLWYASQGNSTDLQVSAWVPVIETESYTGISFSYPVSAPVARYTPATPQDIATPEPSTLLTAVALPIMVIARRRRPRATPQ